jgi:misacylated tRNA(Ala) deacylase
MAMDRMMKMTEPLYLDNAYRRAAPGMVTAHTDRGGVVLDASLFYATGGGQPGDRGRLSWDGGEMAVATSVKGEAPGEIVLVPAEGAALPPVGTEVVQHLDWQTRHAHMRMHTALHLLSVVLPLPVTGGSVGAEKSRLDFAMDEPPEDKAALEEALNALVARDLAVTMDWITDAELEANPGLVKTMSVQPPRGAGRVRLVRIGTAEDQVDLQPCGGTHVARTGEIGRLRIGKIEKKGRLNRRVNIHLDT